MFLKNCPFCNNNVEYVPQEDGTYLMECPTCKEKGITISLKEKNLDKLQKLWNKRAFDDILLDNPIYGLTMLAFYNGNLVNKEKIHEIKHTYITHNYETFNTTEDVFGYLLMPNNEVITCDDEHSIELMRFLGIDMFEDNIEKFDNERIIKCAINGGVIRISKQAKCLMIDMSPEKVSYNQISKLMVLLANTEFKSMKSFCVYLNGAKTVSDIHTFKDLNELLLFLDGIK